MKKGQIAEGTVEKVEFPNKGIVVTDEGERVIVKNTISGQRVRFAVNKARNGKAEARLLETLERSPLETKEVCPHFGVCGGCTYQSLPYEEQLRLKEGQVRELIGHAVGEQCAYEFLGIKGSPRIQEYRNKMEFSFGDAYKDGPLALGMHKRGSFYDIVTVEHCQIVDGDFRAILAATLSFFADRKLPYYHRLRHTGYLRHLLVRKAVRTGEILVDLVTTTQDWRSAQQLSEHGAGSAGYRQDAANVCGHVDLDIPGAGQKETCAGTTRLDGTLEREPSEGLGKVDETQERELLESLGKVDEAQESELSEGRGKVDEAQERELLESWVRELCSLPLSGTLKGVLHTRNDSVADVVKNEGTDVLFGVDHFYEELLGLQFQISPFSFFQTNSLGAEVLYEIAREFILGDAPDALRDKVVYDLYSGTGTIAQMLAPVCKEVVGVEIVEEAVEAARANAARNGLANCSFLAGDVLKMLDTIETRPDYIVLDPPRDGIHPKALEKIIDYGVEHLVYISCKPTSLARDLEVFLRRGYAVEKVGGVDMFPGTYHTETVCLLSKLNVEHHIEVELTMDELDLTAAESKATYEEIKGYVLEHTGLKVSNLYIAQIKQKCGIIERANYNLPKSENSRQPKCPPQKEAAIREALEYFRMIDV